MHRQNLDDRGTEFDLEDHLTFFQKGFAPKEAMLINSYMKPLKDFISGFGAQCNQYADEPPALSLHFHLNQDRDCAGAVWRQ